MSMRRISTCLLTKLCKSTTSRPSAIIARGHSAISTSLFACPALEPSYNSRIITTLPLLRHLPSTSSQFSDYRCRTLSTLPKKPPPFLRSDSPGPPHADDAAEEAFEAATSTADILAAFKTLEATMDEDDIRLGLASLKVGQHLDAIGFEDHEKTLGFAQKALQILQLHAGGDEEQDRERKVSVAMALHLLGSVSFTLQKFGDSLAYLNKANRILGEVEEGVSEEFDIKPISHAVNLQLANTKTAMGRREEALVNLRKCLELKELIFEPDSREVGVAYRDLAEAYVAVLDFKGALPLCQKALDVHKGRLGQNSVEVAHDRRLLGVIYTGLEQHQKALEQNQLSQKVMKNWGLDVDILNAEIEAANMQIALGKYDEAVSTLKGVAQQTDKESQTRALIFIAMARAMSNQEKSEDAKRCLEISTDILEKKERVAPQEVAEGYADIAEIYETMNEFNTAISLLKRAVSLYEKLPQEQYAEANASARIGWLFLLTGKVQEGIPYLESAAERLKESFGPKHFAVGYIYNNLGAAYLSLDRPQSAAQMFQLAKDIMDVALGSQHADTIGACQNLANAYDAMGNYDVALEFQQRAVEAWTNHGSRGEENLQEAKRRLGEIEKKMTSHILRSLEAGVMGLPDDNKANEPAPRRN